MVSCALFSILTVFCVVLVGTEALSDKERFDDFIKRTGKKFDAFEYADRLAIFMQNMLKAQKLTDRKDVNGTFGANRFAASTVDEFRSLLMSGKFVKQHDSGRRADKQRPASSKRRQAPSGSDIPSRVKRQSIPTSFDYRSVGWISSVKDQGGCGSCWAFATAAAMEGVYLSWGTANSGANLAEQQLVSCSTQNSGCGGGLVNLALDYVLTKNLTSETVYPYTGTQTACKSLTAANRKYGGVDYWYLDSEADIADAVYNWGPVAFYFTVPEEFMLYDGDVFDLSVCEQMIDENGDGALHEMTIVGYTPDHWIVKNSWGTSFGDNGYVYWKRGKNLCEMESQLIGTYPTTF